jgi:hypothetical protein
MSAFLSLHGHSEPKKWPVHQEGWMVDEQETLSPSIANHGDG